MRLAVVGGLQIHRQTEMSVQISPRGERVE